MCSAFIAGSLLVMVGDVYLVHESIPSHSLLDEVSRDDEYAHMTGGDCPQQFVLSLLDCCPQYQPFSDVERQKFRTRMPCMSFHKAQFQVF